MNILVFNCGSSSLNYKVFTENNSKLEIKAKGKAHRVGVKGTEPSFIEHFRNNLAVNQSLPIRNHREAASLVINYLHKNKIEVDAIGHRFVHGGSYFKETTLLTPTTYQELKACLPFAPIHNPNSLSVIDECLTAFPEIPQYVTFDTAFHSSIPAFASNYALPQEITQKYQLKKYGFHGLSYQYVTQKAAEFLNKPLESLKIIACHLGTGGSSAAAIKNGVSIDTSMGFSPLAGLMMSTRTGDLDPEIPLLLISHYGYTPDQLDKIFNKESGLLGVSGFSSDIRDIIQVMDSESSNATAATLAFKMYTYRIKQYIGAYAAVLGGLDTLIFTDDIGVISWQVREKVCEEMEWCGIHIDSHRNQSADFEKINMISSETSPVRVIAMPTDEELVIAMEGCKLF